MSDESKKIEKIEQEAKDSEISDQDLENAAGGMPNSVGCPAPTVVPKGQHCGISVDPRHSDV
jgi:hypothetical protein